MTRIMFVCHGNICRSPMAEYIMKDLVKKRGLQDQFIIESRATSTEEIGFSIDPYAKRELKRNGIEVWERKAAQITQKDYDENDLIICMDSKNISNLWRLIPYASNDKVKKLLDYVGGGDVADPWYTARFDIAYADIYKGCVALLNSLAK